MESLDGLYSTAMSFLNAFFGLIAFVLYYTPNGGNKIPLGMCPFLDGCNRAWFSYRNDSNNNQPDCFVRTRWISRDYGENDVTNWWTNESEAEPYELDWADSIADLESQRVDRLSHKFLYLQGPPVDPQLCQQPGAPDRGEWLSSRFVTPLVWPVVTSSIETYSLVQAQADLSDPNMLESPFQFCDLNFDGKCDDIDKQIFSASFGKCRGDAGYNFDADIDGDGCVATNDENISLSLSTIEVVIDIKPDSYPNSTNPRSSGVIPVAILTTDTFDATTVNPLSVKFGPNKATEAHGKGHIEDADDDGDLDLVLHFNTQGTGIQCGDTETFLIGETFNGQAIEGSDSIDTVGCK